MTDAHSIYPHLTVGRPVFSADNAKLGTVREIRGRSFQVEALLRPDYWLTTDTIRSAIEDRVTLIFSADRLSDFTQDRPTLA